MKNFIKTLIAAMITLCGLSAFAQQGFVTVQVPTAYLNYPSQFRVGTAAASGNPISPTITITSDKAGNTTISQPVAIGLQSSVSFFAAPGIYQIQWSTVTANNALGAFTQNIIVPPDANPTSNATAAATDNLLYFPAGACAWNASGTPTGTNGLTATGASFVPTVQAQTSGAGATNDTLTCWIPVPSRLTTGKGSTLNDCTILYGIQTTALTSLGAPTLNTITLPAPGTSETPSTVTPASLGAVTVTPVVGSANLGTTTAGAFFSENIALNTPVIFNTDNKVILYQQVYAQSAAAAQIVQSPGGYCHFQSNPF
jgi:hypothetical protein